MEDNETKEPKEITRVFREVTEKDGTQHLEETAKVSPEPPKDTEVKDNEE